MTNPDKITAAIELLLSMPGVGDAHTLADIVAMNSPINRMARDLIESIRSDDFDPDKLNMSKVGDALTYMAKAHGLRITTDPEPGELIGYAHVRPPATSDSSWFLRDGRTWKPDPESLSDAHACVSAPCRVAAVYLLPEGGKA